MGLLDDPPTDVGFSTATPNRPDPAVGDAAVGFVRLCVWPEQEKIFALLTDAEGGPSWLCYLAQAQLLPLF